MKIKTATPLHVRNSTHTSPCRGYDVAQLQEDMLRGEIELYRKRHEIALDEENWEDARGYLLLLDNARLALRQLLEEDNGDSTG